MAKEKAKQDKVEAVKDKEVKEEIKANAIGEKFVAEPLGPAKQE